MLSSVDLDDGALELLEEEDPSKYRGSQSCAVACCGFGQSWPRRMNLTTARDLIACVSHAICVIKQKGE